MTAVYVGKGVGGCRREGVGDVGMWECRVCGGLATGTSSVGASGKHKTPGGSAVPITGRSHEGQPAGEVCKGARARAQIARGSRCGEEMMGVFHCKTWSV